MTCGKKKHMVERNVGRSGGGRGVRGECNVISEGNCGL